jgi:hypothetical protein
VSLRYSTIPFALLNFLDKVKVLALGFEAATEVEYPYEVIPLENISKPQNIQITKET